MLEDVGIFVNTKYISDVDGVEWLITIATSRQTFVL